MEDGDLDHELALVRLRALSEFERLTTPPRWLAAVCIVCGTFGLVTSLVHLIGVVL